MATVGDKIAREKILEQPPFRHHNDRPFVLTIKIISIGDKTVRNDSTVWNRAYFCRDHPAGCKILASQTEEDPDSVHTSSTHQIGGSFCEESLRSWAGEETAGSHSVTYGDSGTEILHSYIIIPPIRISEIIVYLTQSLQIFFAFHSSLWILFPNGRSKSGFKIVELNRRGQGQMMTP